MLKGEKGLQLNTTRDVNVPITKQNTFIVVSYLVEK